VADWGLLHVAPLDESGELLSEGSIRELEEMRSGRSLSRPQNKEVAFADFDYPAFADRCVNHMISLLI
jgi:hypothetical protein